MKLGITGGICSGKSTVTKLIGGLGASTFSADAVAKELTAPGTRLAREILSIFGPEFATSSDPEEIDRAALGNAVFHNPDLRELLNAITHSTILAELTRLMDLATDADPSRIIAVEIPLLYEAELQTMVDRVLVVWCTEETQLRRLRERQPGLSETELYERIISQMPIDEKRKRADIVVSSELPPAEMEQSVATIYNNLLQPTRA